MSNKYLASKQSMPRSQRRKLSRADLITNLKGSGVKGPLSRMTKAQLLKMHADRTQVATDQDQTLSVMSGSASTNLPVSGSGHSSEIRLEGKQSGSGMVQTGAPPPKPSGSGHCSGGGKQGRGMYQQLVKKHGGNMKAASDEYRKLKGSGFIEDKIKQKVKDVAVKKADAAIDKNVRSKVLKAGLHAGLHAAADEFAGGGKLDVMKFMDQGGTDMDGGSLSEYLDKASKISSAVAAGAALIPGVGEVVAPVALGVSGLTKAGSEIAEVTGNGHLEMFGEGQPLAVEQFLDDELDGGASIHEILSGVSGATGVASKIARFTPLAEFAPVLQGVSVASGLGAALTD